MADMDVIEAEEDEEEAGASDAAAYEPVVVRGSGNVTVFGLNNRFDEDFPPRLTARLAPEEFASTMARLNGVLRKCMPTNLRWLLCGCVFCCCTAGCSLWPVVCLSKRTVRSLDKALDWENTHLYHRLGMHWRLARRRSDSSNMAEYTLLIEFLPKDRIFLPD